MQAEQKQGFGNMGEKMMHRRHRRRLPAGVLAAGIALGIAGCGQTVPTADMTQQTEQVGDVVEDTQTEVHFPEEETEEIVEPVVQTVTISATGDCTLGITQTHGYEGSFDQYYDLYGEEYFFEDVREVFEEDDFTIVNLECVLTTETERVEKTWNLKGRPEYVNIMTSSSVEGCSLGNNHTYDYGQKSHDDTEAVLNEAGIVFGFNGHTGIYTTEEGVSIGVVSANLLSGAEEYENYIQNGIASLKEQEVDIILVCCHWGIELDHFPTEYQTTMAHRIVDWGADLVIGNHPHVPQGIEVYNGKVICYSLGNFCFGGNRNPKQKETMIYQQTFTFVDGQMQPQVDASIIPCMVSSVSDHNDFQPTIVEGDKKQAIIDDINAYSEPYSAIRFDAEGVMYIPEEQTEY